MDWLRLESVRPRQRSCQSRPTGQAVTVRRSALGTGFSGLQSCGSTMCPHCGAKIAAVRRDDIAKGVRVWRERGGAVLFGTLTLRHHAGQSLQLLADSVADCWDFATKGRQWARDRAEHGIAGHVRVWETTHGANGWHQHVHFLVFAEDRVRPDALLASMFARWARRAVALGLDAPLMVGQDLHLAVGSDDAVADLLGDYFAKQAAFDGSAKTAQGLGAELAGQGTKLGRSGVTPAQLLDLAVAGHERATHLWHEYELTMHGRRTIAWTRGLRDLLGLDVELTDQEVAEEEAGDVEDTLITIERRTFGRIVRAGGRGPLLEYASDPAHSALEVARWCRARGWIVRVGLAADWFPESEAA